MVLGIFPRQFHVTIYQLATSKKLCLAFWGPAGWNGTERWGSERLRGASAATKADLGGCRLENCTIGKFPFGKMPIEKYL